MIELKKCPFCGGEADIGFSEKSFIYTDKNGKEADTGFFYTVTCNDDYCGCRIGVYEDIDMAIEAWNRRCDGDTH